MEENLTMFVNCSNISYISGTVEEYLRQLQDNTNITMIPAVVMMAIFIVTGLIGNSFVLVVYSKKMKLTPTKVLIMTIATFDLVSNTGAIPSEMNIMFNFWNFSQPGVCKFKVFVGSFTTLGGAMTLCVVAFVRFRKVCRPYGWQVTIRQAVIASGVTACLAFLFSIPYIIIYGIKTKNTPCPMIKGYECFADDSFFYTVWPLLNNLLFILLYLGMSISMVVFYSFIGVTAWKHSKLHGVSSAPTYKKKDNSTSGLSSDDSARIGNNHEIQQAQPENSSNVDKINIFRRRSIKSILCCSEIQRNVKTGEVAENSISMKVYKTPSTTDTGIEDRSIDLPTGSNDKTSDLAEINSTDNRDLSNIYKRPDRASLILSEEIPCQETQEKSTCFENKGVKTSIEVRHTQDNSLSGSSNARRENNQEQIISNICSNQQNTFVAKKVVTKSGKKDEQRRPLGRMTLMLTIISAIFILGFLPFLALTMFKNRQPDKYDNLNMAELSVFNFFYRLYFLNSAANPIIYSLCDMNFRREIIRLLSCRSRR